MMSDAKTMPKYIAFVNQLGKRRVEPPRRYAPPLLIQGEFPQITWDCTILPTSRRVLKIQQSLLLLFADIIIANHRW